MEAAVESGNLADEIEAAIDEIEAVEVVETEGAANEGSEGEAGDASGGAEQALGQSSETPGEEATAEADDPKPQEDEGKLEPYHHWKDGYKEVFSSLSRQQQDVWLEREREFSRGIQQKAQEANQFKGFQDSFTQIINPLVQGWQMKGLSPSQGITRLVAMESALRENPQETLMGLAAEYGVNLETAFKDAPYVDPTVKALQKELQEMKQDRDNRQMQHDQRAQQQAEENRKQALSAFEQFSKVTDEGGNLKYPYATDDKFMDGMAHAMTTGQAATLEQAYQVVQNAMLQHPLYQQQLQQVTKEKAETTQAKVERAKQASKVVEGDSTDSQVSRSLRDDILEAAETAGI